MRLAQLSELNTERGRAALAALLEVSPYLRFLDQHSAFEEQGTEFIYHIVNGAATLQRRALGGEYNVDDRVPPNPQNGGLAFVGDSVDIDESHIADSRRGLLDIDRWIDTEIVKSVRKFGKLYVQDLFQGTGAGAPRQVKGLRTILDGVTDVPGFDAGYKAVVDAATATAAADDKLDLTNSANYDAFLEAFEQWVADVDDARGGVVNKKLGAKLTTIARVKHIIGESRDLFGRPIPTINGIPIVRERNEVITNTEPDNAGVPVNDTTSMYIVNPGEGAVSVVTNSGLSFDDEIDLETKESRRIKWEIRSDNTIQERDRILRVRNIKV